MTRAIAVALTLSLGACSSWSPPVSQTPDIGLPEHWSGAADSSNTKATSSLARWWEHFRDPLLGGLVMQALQANTSIRSAQAALEQSRALRDVQAAGLFPAIGASVSAQRSKSGTLDAKNNFGAGMDASWEPDIFGARRSAVDASEAEVKLAQTTLADVQVSMAAEVALAYIQLRGQQAQLKIARDSLASQSETLQITDWRAQAGLITSLEVEQARTTTEQTQAQIPVLQADIGKTRHSLALLTGKNPDALQALLDTPLPVPQAAPDLVLSIPAQTLRQRADVRSAEHRISAALARLSAAQAARYPSFSIRGSIGLNALSLGALGNSASMASSLLGAISIPLFDGGAVQAQVQAQAAALEQARVNYQFVVLTALKEVEDALVTLRGDRERLMHLQSAVLAATNADLLAQQRYSSGLIDFQIVLQTQRSLLATQVNLASIQVDISADHVRLYKALGGGWN
jgi:NodT family efflux transporter outer membrane factor (OMF) lipoprotein